MTLIVDASVAAKWFFEEEGSARALKLREESDLIAPDFILLEVHHAMWKRLARRETEKIAVERVQPALRIAIPALIASQPLAEAAGRISLTQGLAIYDCLYLALAAETGDRLITADQRQFSTARRMRLKTELL
ncbi:MAG: type II toxin-antitoxin system VapC family toxin [Methylobacteriaceae bacterium]|nr:type II toxin-antitoxin system VapC family toxin [Methylobacteriaceae bacterium]